MSNNTHLNIVTSGGLAVPWLPARRGAGGDDGRGAEEADGRDESCPMTG